MVHGQVGFVCAVHAEHAQEVLVGSRQSPQPHQRQRTWKAGGVDQPFEAGGRRRTGIDDPAAGVDDRPLGPGHQLHRSVDQPDIAFDPWLVALDADLVRPDIDPAGVDHVLGQIDHHRSGAAMGGDVKRLVQDAGKVIDVLDQVVVLGAGSGDTRGIGLLEGVVADQRRRHLAGDADDRDAIHQGVGETGDRIGGAGARCHQDHARLARRTGVTFRRVHGRLLVPGQHVPQAVLFVDFIVKGKSDTAGIAENHLHALVLEGPQENFRSR